jgi:hypothetical protein
MYNAAMESEPAKATPPKHARRWFQFSLRTLLILTLIVAIPCAWIGRKIEKKRRERGAVEAIRASGGTASYDYEVPWSWFDRRDERFSPSYYGPDGPSWLRGMLGEDFFNEIVQVDLSRVPVARLDWLDTLPQLRWLRVSRPDLADADLTHIRDLTQLRSLELVRTKVSDSGMMYLGRLTKLQHLNLCGTRVTDAGLVHLKQLPRLQTLVLFATNVTDAGVHDLQKALPNCTIGY